MTARKKERERFSRFAELAGAVLEAWAELRIHRGRVLLSLIGVAIAVCALTTVVGLGAIVQQSTTESFERGSGRPAALSINVHTQSGNPVAGEEFTSEIRAVTERYGIDYWSRTQYGNLAVQFADGTRDVSAQAVDADYGTMHRIQIVAGRWLEDADELRLAPAVVVNDVFYHDLGSPDLRSHPVVTLLGDSDVTAVVVGVTPSSGRTEPSMFLLSSAYVAQATPQQLAENPPQYEVWVPPKESAELAAAIGRDVKSTLPDGVEVDVNRQDYLSYGGPDPLLPVKLVLGG
ncbi:MAG: ABC transporter permease, partial [Lacisediminihabitans sp.]